MTSSLSGAGMATDVSPLFEPWSHGRLALRNRVVMAPMTRLFSPQGIPGADVAAYYRRRAQNEVGLIITEGTAVDHATSSLDRSVPNFFGEAIHGWKRVVEEVHEAGGKIVPQLWHAGSGRDAAGNVWNKDVPSATPSGIDAEGKTTLAAMSVKDIQSVIDAFARAASEAERLGFDGIELHGAHGYLIDSFLWSFTNRRRDDYGGDMIERTAFAARLVRAVRSEISREFPVIFRFSQWKSADYSAKLAANPEELGRLLVPLIDAGVDIFHCSTRRFWDPEFPDDALNLAGWVKKLTGKPTITVGSVGLGGPYNRLDPQPSPAKSLDSLIPRLAAEEFDLVAVGRALLADPEWASKIRTGRLDQLRGFDPAMREKLE